MEILKMKAIIPIIAILLIIAGCSNKKPLTTRDIAISLTEKEYKVNGRNLEYSQLDSVDAELKGYRIERIYISDDDSIRYETFHLNYKKNKITKNITVIVHPDLYKTLLLDGKVFTNDFKADRRRIYRANGKFHGIDSERYYQFVDSLMGY